MICEDPQTMTNCTLISKSIGGSTSSDVVLADSKELIAPCGACLQRIKEFADDSTLILLANMQGIQKQFTIAELLPFGFVSSELKK